MMPLRFRKAKVMLVITTCEITLMSRPIVRIGAQYTTSLQQMQSAEDVFCAKEFARKARKRIRRKGLHTLRTAGVRICGDLTGNIVRQNDLGTPSNEMRFALVSLSVFYTKDSILQAFPLQWHCYFVK